MSDPTKISIVTCARVFMKTNCTEWYIRQHLLSISATKCLWQSSMIFFSRLLEWIARVSQYYRVHEPAHARRFKVCSRAGVFVVVGETRRVVNFRRMGICKYRGSLRRSAEEANSGRWRRSPLPYGSLKISTRSRSATGSNIGPFKVDRIVKISFWTTAHAHLPPLRRALRGPRRNPSTSENQR